MSYCVAVCPHPWPITHSLIHRSGSSICILPYIKYQILGVGQRKLAGRSVMTSSSSLLNPMQVKLNGRYQFSLDVLVYENMYILLYISTKPG